jgi:SAM-dependent methyltransferase
MQPRLPRPSLATLPGAHATREEAHLPPPGRLDSLAGSGRRRGIFDSPAYVEARQARLCNLFAHVDPAGLVGKRVLELGCATGELGQAFVEHGATVVSVDARQAHIAELRARYPDRQAHVADLETWDPGALGRFDAILCFGLLYHLAAPVDFLAACTRASDTIYLETVVVDASASICLPVDEAGDDQAFSLRGCRPSPSWIADTLARHRFSVRDISGAAANWGGAAPSIFDWRIEESGTWKRGECFLRKMFVCTRECR